MLYEMWHICEYINKHRKEKKRIWQCCHLPWAKQHLFLNDVFVLVFLVSHQLSTSAITLQRYILFFNIVFFCKRQLSPTKQSHLLKWLKWKQYFLWIPMFATEHLSTLPLNSNFIYSNSFFFSCVHIICNLQLWVFCLTQGQYLLCCYFFQEEPCGDRPSPPTWDKQACAFRLLSDQESAQDYVIH